MDLCDERRTLLTQELGNTPPSPQEGGGFLIVRGSTREDECGDSVREDRLLFERVVAQPGVDCQEDPAAPSDFG